MSLYAYAIPSRAGLGNMLLPWARAEIFARKNNAKMLAPFWPPFRIGPYLRKEPDKRNYRGFFHNPAHIGGLQKRFILFSCATVKEAVLDHGRIENESTRAVVRFEGLGRPHAYFKPLWCDRPHVRAALWTMTVPSLRDDGGRGVYAAIHVRRGDVTRAGLENLPIYTSIDWYRQIAAALRSALPDMPILLFTDGSEDEVRPLLEIPNIRIKPRRTAITDLWTLSHARLLIATGYSTFSMWASYLGGMPTIYAPGKMQEFVQGPSGLETELAAGDAIPLGLLDRV